ncbi:MAG TPA: hypothetical protein GX708_24330, partial [Gallicola sp.]|nr:hypothetical protein [Gallicola sp.]
KLKNKYRNEFALNDKNVEKICSRLNILKNSNIDKKILSEFISDIIDENAISNDLDTIIISKFRIALIDCFEEFVLNFKNLYNQIQISEEEIKRINNLDTLLSIVSLIEHNDDIDKLISNQFNTIESNNKKNILLKLIDVIPNYNFIYYIDVKKMLDSDKNEIYLQICKKNISDNEKLELLLYLDYNNSNIADELISGKNINEEKLISYLNRQNTCSELCKSYINNSNKVFTISDVIYNSLDKNSEKYHAYYMLKHHKISDTCDAKMLSEIFLNYSCPEILDCYKNNSIIGILKKQGVYRKFSSNNVSKEKMLLLTIVPQTKDMVSSIISNDSISQDNKRAYIENINEISKDASIYITSLIKKSTPIALLKAVDKNRGKIYSSFDKTYKTRVKKDLNKIIPKEDPVQSSD